MNDLSFCRLNANDFDAAYGIIVEVTDWLLAKGIRQWVRPLPVTIYRQRHEAGYNYGLWSNNALVAVVSLLPSLPEIWADQAVDTPLIWIATLATAVKFKGQHLGKIMLLHIEDHCRTEGVHSIYLDCATGFLPVYYEAAGYQVITQRRLEFSEHIFDAVLMRKLLDDVS